MFFLFFISLVQFLSFCVDWYTKICWFFVFFQFTFALLIFFCHFTLNENPTVLIYSSSLCVYQKFVWINCVRLNTLLRKQPVIHAFKYLLIMHPTHSHSLLQFHLNWFISTESLNSYKQVGICYFSIKSNDIHLHTHIL